MCVPVESEGAYRGVRVYVDLRWLAMRVMQGKWHSDQGSASGSER